MAAAATAYLLLAAAAPVTDLTIDVARLRSARGLIRICVTADPANFPGCVDDAQAVTRTISADPGANGGAFSAADRPGERSLVIVGLPRSDYAVAVIHDENGNGRLDTIAGIPREGFGFSRNPRIGFGPPHFAAARFVLTSDADRQQIVLHYLL